MKALIHNWLTLETPPQLTQMMCLVVDRHSQLLKLLSK